MSIAVILAAAGQSHRFGGKRKKPFIDLKGRAVWLRAAEHFVNRDDVSQTLIAIAPDDIEWFKAKFRPNLAFTNIEIVGGGSTRAESVKNALDQVSKDIEIVAVHDAARPLLARKWIDEIFETARKTGAAIPATPVSATLKRVANGRIEETVPRESLWQAQTPQTFRRKLLLDAYAHAKDMKVTDEAQLVEQFGHAVSIVEGSPMNIKITRQPDLRMAEALLGVLPKDKGLGGLHPFADEEPRLL